MGHSNLDFGNFGQSTLSSITAFMHIIAHHEKSKQILNRLNALYNFDAVEKKSKFTGQGHFR